MVIKEKDILKQYEKMVVSICKNYPTYMFEDLCQEGRIAVLKAYRCYDKNKGANLSTHISKWVKGKVSNYFRDKGSIIRIPRIEYENGNRYINIVKTDNLIHIEDEVNYDNQCQSEILFDLIKNNMDTLTYNVFVKRYRHDMSQVKIGNEYGITQMKVSRILKKCIDFIKEQYDGED